MTQTTTLPVDVQSFEDTRKVAINQVGIKDLRLPLAFENNNEIQHTVAMMTLTVNLLASEKGTHMSRFIETWQAQASPFSLRHVRGFLTGLREALGSNAAHMTLGFPLFFKRTAPVSKAVSVADFNCVLEAGIIGDEAYYNLKLRAPVTSLCPCSKAISRYSAHSQRSELTVTLSFEGQQAFERFIIDDFIKAMESVASSQLYPLLKRPDEKYVTEKAYENPRFVEDLVRELVLILLARQDLKAFTVESENYESIHNHQAYAKVSHSF